MWKSRPRYTFSEDPLVGTFVLLVCGCAIADSIFFPYGPYEQVGDTFVGKMGRQATAEQYRLHSWLVRTYLVSWIGGALSVAFTETMGRYLKEKKAADRRFGTTGGEHFGRRGAGKYKVKETDIELASDDPGAGPDGGAGPPPS